MSLRPHLSAVVLGLVFCASTALAALTPGVTLNFDAATDTAGDATWDPDGTGSSSARNFSFINGAQSPVVVADPGTAGITAAYAFPAGVATSTNYENFNEGADATFEIWFKPDNLEGKHVLFETGGNTDGTLFEINGKMVVFNTNDNKTSRLAAGALAGDITDRHHQAVATIDFTGGGAATMNLYIDGQLAATDTIAGGFSDWTGNNNAGLGAVNAEAPGGQNLTSSFTDFDGEIGVFRFYENKALTAAEVKDNYDAVASAAPAPASAAPTFNDLQLSWDADAPGNDAANFWRPNFAEAGADNWDLAGTNKPALTTVTSDATIIDSAYSFDGTGTAQMDNTWPNTTSNGLIEMWIKPDDLTGQEVVLEMGGNTIGSSFVLDGSMLKLTAKDNAAVGTAQVDLTGLLDDDFIQIAGYLDVNGDLLRLYVNGTEVDSALVDTSSHAFDNFAGSDDNGLGSAANQIGGDLSGFAGFEGLISNLRFYTADLSQEEAAALVSDNYNAMLAPETGVIIPEPATALLTLMGVGFIATRLRRRR